MGARQSRCTCPDGFEYVRERRTCLPVYDPADDWNWNADGKNSNATSAPANDRRPPPSSKNAPKNK